MYTAAAQELDARKTLEQKAAKKTSDGEWGLTEEDSRNDILRQVWLFAVITEWMTIWHELLWKLQRTTVWPPRHAISDIYLKTGDRYCIQSRICPVSLHNNMCVWLLPFRPSWADSFAPMRCACACVGLFPFLHPVISLLYRLSSLRRSSQVLGRNCECCISRIRICCRYHLHTSQSLVILPSPKFKVAQPLLYH